MIGIIDYGMGNLLSVFNAVEYLGFDAEICADPARLYLMEKIILPGVGAFGDCMKNLKGGGFKEVLNQLVLKEKKPILGICLGMQAMAKIGHEGGNFKGLGWFDAEVVRIEPSDPKLKVPQIGWNNVVWKKDHPVLKGLPESPDLYFVHSFHMKCKRTEDLLAVCDYGGEVTAAVAKDNICATQFHPEKSQDYGLKILENFLTWNP
jgi:glutamine amidotransferase